MTARRDGPLRIAFCIDSLDVGGTELNAVRTAEHLVGTGEVTLFVYHMQGDGPLLARYRDIAANLRRVSLRNLYGPLTFKRGLEFARSLRSDRVEVLHCHDVYSNIFGVPWARLGAAKAAIASRRWTDSLPRPGLAVPNRWVSRWATRVLANSERIAQLVESEGVPRERVFMLPNFLDDSAFEDLDPTLRADQLGSFGIPSGRLVIGAVGRLVPEKGYEHLLRAVAKLENGIEPVILLVGEGPERQRLSRLAHDLGIGDRLFLPGTLRTAWNLQQLMDLIVMPSVSEGFPNSLIEAMAAQRPIVATRVGGIPDALEHGVTGLLTEAGSVDDLTASIRTLLGDRSLAGRLGTQAREVARSRFGAEQVIGRLLDLYRSLAQEGAT